ncbi:MAG: hypothetical protein A2V64_08020 [Bacteroidetes bacterium RBG_13_43_22]|nr:MAG: hypothetical protein A2V64_08020 [Bacteroidetes bacterium RBG_13_43_22]
MRYSISNLRYISAQQFQAQKQSPLYKPLFRVREKANSNAEADLIYQYNKLIVPVEVKAGSVRTSE